MEQPYYKFLRNVTVYNLELSGKIYSTQHTSPLNCCSTSTQHTFELLYYYNNSKVCCVEYLANQLKTTYSNLRHVTANQWEIEKLFVDRLALDSVWL